MYLKSRVKIPDVHGKLTRLRREDITSHILSMSMITIMIQRKNIPIHREQL